LNPGDKQASSSEPALKAVDTIYRTESRAVLATLIRLLGDFDLAEEALHEAFKAALEQWPADGVPADPRAWLVSTGRFKAIDMIRKQSRLDPLPDNFAEQLTTDMADTYALDNATVEDDRLRLIFTCCHPALALDAQVALTLREVCGLSTEEIARAFLTSAPTLAQRIVRAKAKIRNARIPYQVPESADLSDRLDAVLRVVYLVFNEGYAASSGATIARYELTSEAISLGRMLLDLLPDPDVAGLVGLMLLQDSRRAARVSSSGDLVLLEDQDRTLWNRDDIREGTALVQRALATDEVGPYSIQAAIAAVHANAASAAETDWGQIVALYDLLLRSEPSPVIELNRAVAMAMHDGPEAGLTLIDTILARGDLQGYHLAHAARADLCRRLGRTGEARAAYERALSLTQQGPERRFLQGRLADLK